MDEPVNAGMQNKMFFIVKLFVYNPSSAALYGHVSCAALVANCNKVEWKHRAGTVLVYRGCSFAVAVLIGARFRQDSIRVARLQGPNGLTGRMNKNPRKFIVHCCCGHK